MGVVIQAGLSLYACLSMLVSLCFELLTDLVMNVSDGVAIQWSSTRVALCSTPFFV